VYACDFYVEEQWQLGTLRDNNLADYTQKKLNPFTYERNGKVIKMSYHEAPAEVYDDSDRMQYWANKAIEAAINSHKK